MRWTQIVQLAVLAAVVAAATTVVAVVIPWLPPSAAEQRDRIDFTFWLATAICIFIFSVVVSVILFFPLPGAIERENEAGLVGFTLRLLLRGTLRRTEARLAEAIEALGSSIEFDADDEYCRVSLDCTADTLAESLDLLAEVLNEPAFEPEELEKERQSTQASIRRRDDSRTAVGCNPCDPARQAK